MIPGPPRSQILSRARCPLPHEPKAVVTEHGHDREAEHHKAHSPARFSGAKVEPRRAPTAPSRLRCAWMLAILRPWDMPATTPPLRLLVPQPGIVAVRWHIPAIGGIAFLL